MIAFQQVEVLKDGATALYGSEAVAGVVNFVTRDRFDGFQLEATAQSVDGTPQRDLEISGLFGGGDYRTRALIAFSHLSRDMLTTADRRLSTTSDDLSQAGNPGTFPRADVDPRTPSTARSGPPPTTRPTTGSRTSSSRSSATRRCRARSRRCSRTRAAST